MKDRLPSGPQVSQTEGVPPAARTARRAPLGCIDLQSGSAGRPRHRCGEENLLCRAAHKTAASREGVLRTKPRAFLAQLQTITL
jgi:hypothetical protein